MKLFSFFTALVFAQQDFASIMENNLPVVIFHGVNDDCKNDQVANLKFLIESIVEGGYAECVDIGGEKAKSNSLLEALDKQGEDYCKAIQSHPVFGNSDFNIIGLS